MTARDEMRASTERTIDPHVARAAVSSCSTAKTRAVMRPPDRQVEVMAIRLRRLLRCTKVHQRPRSWTTSYGDEAHERPDDQMPDPLATEVRTGSDSR
jgi:hypothetical protein